MAGDTVIKGSMSVGAVLAMICSFSVNKSILWAIVHGIFSWLYVIYFVVYAMW